ncbi:CoA ester lyase [Rhodoferax lacus]|uniref:CoA ester lyase n=1 Tax=Rhodoferax lacus TaxID=2184758 RepID=A0A3E1RCS9_9BURK|nr:aldolase/citrate lyase family protein [Rhodoferax lacus]RFO96832.1 CoA ester lyase [Rhodoferax lacus]
MRDVGLHQPPLHPRAVLLGAQGATGFLPVCDHYSGVEARMKKSLQLQADMAEEFGACVFDVTLDCEDGAPAGAEVDQAHRVAGLANTGLAEAKVNPHKVPVRVGARLHPVEHAFFHSDADIVVGTAAAALAYVMVPKVDTVADVEAAIAAIDAAAAGKRLSLIPLHVLIESPAAVHQAFAIARHPRVESISFGLMDFVSAHGGAIPSSAMGVRAQGDNHTLDQFSHPLVLRAKLEIASACHAYGKVPSHCVVTEFRDTQALEQAARTAAHALGYTRMWSIHPDQIRPILKAFSPSEAEVELASTIVLAAQAQSWAPISLAGKLHDRASYRYFWQVLERAHQTGSTLPKEVRGYFAPEFSPAVPVAAELL